MNWENIELIVENIELIVTIAAAIELIVIVAILGIWNKTSGLHELVKDGMLHHFRCIEVESQRQAERHEEESRRQAERHEAILRDMQNAARSLHAAITTNSQEGHRKP